MTGPPDAILWAAARTPPNVSIKPARMLVFASGGSPLSCHTPRERKPNARGVHFPLLPFLLPGFISGTHVSVYSLKAACHATLLLSIPAALVNNSLTDRLTSPKSGPQRITRGPGLCYRKPSKSNAMGVPPRPGNRALQHVINR